MFNFIKEIFKSKEKQEMVRFEDTYMGKLVEEKERLRGLLPQVYYGDFDLFQDIVDKMDVIDEAIGIVQKMKQKGIELL